MRWSFLLWLLIVLAGAAGLVLAFAERIRIGVEVGDFVLLFPAVAVLVALVALAGAARAGGRRARAVLTLLTGIGWAVGVLLMAIAALYGDFVAAAAMSAVVLIPPLVGQVLMYVPAAGAHFGRVGPP
ncbi:hypothetical protein [Kitasatospora sp. NPDC059327]|uniref:hypothetical protein n=1 Tax=Kitasatospora sp. NPDC059327 TaxID=3346803 RepID=UPI00368EA05F